MCWFAGMVQLYSCCDYKFNLQALKLDEVLSEGYRVLKEVKRHKNKVETEWDLTNLQEW